jgi:hypothetical protein
MLLYFRILFVFTGGSIENEDAQAKDAQPRAAAHPKFVF